MWVRVRTCQCARCVCHLVYDGSGTKTVIHGHIAPVFIRIPCRDGTPPPLPLRMHGLVEARGWALNRRLEEIMGPLFLWSRMEDWVSVERLYRERGDSHVCDGAFCS